MMISKRQFFAIVLIFSIVFLLFQGLQVGRIIFTDKYLNKYYSGEFIAENSSYDEDVFAEYTEGQDSSEFFGNKEKILYLGGEGPLADTVKEWAHLTKRKVAVTETFPAEVSAFDYILVAPEYVEENVENFSSALDDGVNVIFLSLPGAELITENADLFGILGIHRCYEKEITLHGIHLFRGFLLGGERILEVTEPATEKDLQMQDLDLVSPWYSVRNGTKTFIQGILAEDDLQDALARDLKNEDMPAIIWRNHFSNGEVYAVCGDYLENRRIGIGVLEAFIYESNEYDIYPVVNAQVFSLVNFPILSDENTDKVENVYGKSITRTQSDIILPMLQSLSAKYYVKPTCFMSVKNDYTDGAYPKSGILDSYLDLLTDVNGELALSTARKGDISIKEKLSSDSEFYRESGSKYPLSAVLVNSGELEEFESALGTSGFDNVKTVSVSDYSDEMPVVGYLNHDVTYQQSTSDLRRHTFTNELELLSVHTLLAYCNSIYDMTNTLYPETSEDEWQNASREVFSNLTTYNHPFKFEDHLSMTEGDNRVRAFFSVNYDETRTGDTITLNIDSESDSSCFILRTHNERVVDISGAECINAESDAYLLKVSEKTVEIKLESTLDTLLDIRGGNR